jgi:hypothetical protein
MNIEITCLRTKLEVRLDPMIFERRLCGLKTPGDAGPVGPNFLEIDCRHDDFHIVQTKLATLGNHVAYPDWSADLRILLRFTYRSK